MDKLEYLVESRKTIQKDEWGYYGVLGLLYIFKVDKKISIPVAIAGAGMLIKSYMDYWKTQNSFEADVLSEEQKINLLRKILK